MKPIEPAPSGAAFSGAQADPGMGQDLSRLFEPLTAGGGNPFAVRTQDGDELDPEVGGRYQIVEVIGEGGFGTVYRARQQYPVRREVALKLVKLGMDTRTVIARFEAERQALALMEHPGVAKVFDAGSTRHGRPYFVMELVRGEPITEYCRSKSLPLRRRLDLFVQVCDAVQHAHTKGVIHRDLKPSNVLVAEVDGKPQPKVIDFGIAKATSARLTERTIFTEQRQFIGTPEYMSPEQAEMSGLDVDTRTDVYSLGVVLYELLTGMPPFDAKRLRSAGLEEVQRILREEEPPRPSTRASTLASPADRPPGGHIAPPSDLARTLRGDLDWIVMKALEKERARRYESPRAFADDIQRYLDNEPVEASPPSVVYRFRKYARRHAGLLLAAAAVTLALVLGLAATSVGFVKAREEARRASQAESRALDQANAARRAEAAARDSETAAKKAESEAKRAEADALVARDESEEVTTFLVDMFTAADPGLMNKDVTVREVLDVASDELGDRFQDSSLVAARLEDAIGRTYQSLGLYAQAESHLRAALEKRTALSGAEDRETLLATSRLAVLLHSQGRTADGRTMLESALKASEARFGRDHEMTLLLMGNLGTLVRREGDVSRAESLLRETRLRAVRAYGPDNPRAVSATHNLALLLQTTERFEEALELSLEVVNSRRREFGSKHPLTMTALSNLGVLYGQMGNAEMARSLQENVLRISEEVRGVQHPRTRDIRHNLALRYLKMGQLEEARTLAHDVHENEVRQFGDFSERALNALRTVAAIEREMRNYDEARRILLDVADRAESVLGPAHTTTLRATYDLALVLFRQKMIAEAAALMQDGLDTSARAHGDADPTSLDFLEGLINLRSALQEEDAAADLQLRYARALREVRGRHDPQTLLAVHKSVDRLLRRGRSEEASQYALEVFNECRVDAPDQASRAARTLAWLYQELGDPAEADRWRAEMQALATQSRPPATQPAQATTE